MIEVTCPHCGASQAIEETDDPVINCIECEREFYLKSIFDV